MPSAATRPHPVSIDDARPSRVYYDRRRRRDSVRDHQKTGEAGQKVGEDTNGQAHFRITQAYRTGRSGLQQPLAGSRVRARRRFLLNRPIVDDIYTEEEEKEDEWRGST